MGVASSPKVQIDISFRGTDATGKASKSATKNIGSVQKAAKKTKGGMSGLAGGAAGAAFGFNQVAAAAKLAIGAVQSLGGAFADAAEEVARIEGAFGSLDAGMARLAASGGAMTIDAFARFTSTIQRSGVELNLTQEHVQKIGALSARMGIDSDRGFQMIATAIAKGRTASLSQIGLFDTMTVELARISKATGRSTQSFGNLERRQIALNLVMRQLNETAVQGGRAFGELDQAGRNLSNLWSGIKNNVLVPVGEYFASNINVLFEEFASTSTLTGISVKRTIGAIGRHVKKLAADTEAVVMAVDKLRTTARSIGASVDRATSAGAGVDLILSAGKRRLALEAKIKKVVAEKTRVLEAGRRISADVLKIEGQIRAIASRANAERRAATARQDAYYAKLRAEADAYDRRQAVERVTPARHPNIAEMYDSAKRYGHLLKDLERRAASLEPARLALIAQRARLSEGGLTNARERAGVEAALEVTERARAEVLEKQLFLMKALGKLSALRHRDAIGESKSLVELMKSDRARFGASAASLRVIRKLRISIAHEEREAAIVSARARVVELNGELSKLRIMREQTREIVSQASARVDAAAIILRMQAAIARAQGTHVGVAQLGSWTAASRQLAQAKAAAAVTRATQARSEHAQRIAKAQLAQLIRHRGKVGFARGGARAPFSVEQEKGAAAALLGLAKIQAQIDESRLRIRRELTTSDKIRLENRRAALGVDQAGLEHDKRREAIAVRVADIQEKIRKRGRRMTGKDRASAEAAFASLTFAARLNDEKLAKRRAAIESKRLLTVKQIAEADRVALRDRVASMRETLGMMSPIAAAQEKYKRTLREINSLHKIGLTVEQQRALIEGALLQKRVDMFTRLTTTMQGAISMAVGLDSIVQKYAAIGNAAGASGAVALTMGQKAVRGTALLLQSMSQQSKLIAETVTAFRVASEKGAIGYAKAAEGAIIIGGRLAASVIDDEKAKAAVLAAMEGAAAVAAFAGGNVVGGIAHTLAAGLYAAVAGTAKQGGGAATETEAVQVRAEGGEAAAGGGAMIININAPVIGGTDQEIGAKIGQWLDGARRAGYG